MTGGLVWTALGAVRAGWALQEQSLLGRRNVLAKDRSGVMFSGFTGLCFGGAFFQIQKNLDTPNISFILQIFHIVHCH